MSTTLPLACPFSMYVCAWLQPNASVSTQQMAPAVIGQRAQLLENSSNGSTQAQLHAAWHAMAGLYSNSALFLHNIC